MTKLEQCKNLLGCWEQPDYRYRQVLHAVFRERVSRFQDMTALPKDLRQKLCRELGDSVLSLRPIGESCSGQADKLLFELPGGGRIEAVRLHYKKGWESFCISSQCGCAFGCKFCATGAMGKLRNLTAWEIAEELLYFYLQGCELDSVSFMGMGEPLANPHIWEALSLLTDPRLFGLSQRRITVSTVGVAPGIRRLTLEFPQVNLAYSLHAPTPELRRKLMPVEDRWSMEQVLPLLNDHIRRSHRRVFLAYTLCKNINDSPAHARKLAQLLRQNPRELPLYHVDLIPCNETDHAGGIFRSPEPRQVEEFLQVLRRAGVSCSARTQFGADISAACGQLAARNQ